MAAALAPSPAPWQLALARLEGALPLVSDSLAQVLAMRSLRRLWAVHIRDYPFENIGLKYNPGLEAAELMRSWYAEERRDFLSWVSRRGPPPLARAASLALAAKGATESFASVYAPADLALARLDELLLSPEPLATLVDFVEQLRTEEIVFLESGTEIRAFGGKSFDRPAPKGAAWAASLAVAVRPQLFGLGAAPLALSGLAPRKVFRPEPEDPIPAILRETLAGSVDHVHSDLKAAQRGLHRAKAALVGLYGSSRAPDAWCLLLGLGPLTRAELARALEVTKRTASQAALALVQAGLVEMRAGDAALVMRDALRR